MQVKQISVKDIIPYARNPRRNEAAIDMVAASIKEFGFQQPIVVDEESVIIAGHTRFLASKKLKLDKVPVVVAKDLTAAQVKAYRIADNKIHEASSWDEKLLSIELEELEGLSFDMSLMGFSEEELERLSQIDQEIDNAFSGQQGNTSEGNASLLERFLVPPFSILDARQGYWQDRKRQWCNLGIQSEIGRGSYIADEDGNIDPNAKSKFAQSMPSSIGEKYGRKPSPTSVFDPVLCEVIYSWFCPPDGIIIDPFAGGSVRGIVASKLSRKYYGVDLRHEQIEANNEQAKAICDNDLAKWYVGDSRDIGKILKNKQADLIFSCPPYGDLEVYSDDPKDISTLKYEEFRQAYFDIIKKTTALLKDNRFACFVVGEFRSKNNGTYQNFVSDTIQAFTEAGLNYYNEAILVTVCGTLPIRAGRQFQQSRKIGKTHQNVLIFVKGDPLLATQACGNVELTDLGIVEEDDIADDDLGVEEL